MDREKLAASGRKGRGKAGTGPATATKITEALSPAEGTLVELKGPEFPGPRAGDTLRHT